MSVQGDRIRDVEHRISYEYKKGLIKTPIHLCLGSEEFCVRICADLRSQDLLFAYYRSHGWYLAKGGNLKKMIAELYGNENGCSRGYGGSMHLIDLDVGFHGTTAIVGSQIAHAVGAALAIKMKGEDKTVTCVFGDGATEEGIFTESLMFAALHKLPIVFICMSDGYAAETLTFRTQSCPLMMRVQPLMHYLSVENDNGFSINRGSLPLFINYRFSRACYHVGPVEIPLNPYGNPEINEAFDLAKETR